MSTTRRVYEVLIRRGSRPEGDASEPVSRDVPGNALRLVGATALQRSGEQAVNASTVLPALFSALGVPVALTGLLVPIRESGSMLPQAALTPVVLRVARRKWVFVAGALVQAVAVAVMALIAAWGRGLTAGVLILVALGAFSLGRSLCSIASKDVQGRTIPKGERGQITGLSTTASGVVAVTLGLGLRTFGGDELAAGQLAWLLLGGAVLWGLAAGVYAGVIEPVDEDTRSSAPQPAESSPGWWAAMVALLRDDAPFRRFVLTRSLLLVSALSPPFIVSQAVSSGAGGLGEVGGFVIAAALSAIAGGMAFGRLADRSSRTLMAGCAGLASAVLILFVVASRLTGFDGDTAWGAAAFLGAYFVLTFVHTGTRVARKTYVVDMAEGDQRTQYVAVSNTAMGVILLLAGALSALLATWGVDWALLFLAGLGLLGVVSAARLPDVSAG